MNKKKLRSKGVGPYSEFHDEPFRLTPQKNCFLISVCCRMKIIIEQPPLRAVYIRFCKKLVFIGSWILTPSMESEQLNWRVSRSGTPRRGAGHWTVRRAGTGTRTARRCSASPKRSGSASALGRRRIVDRPYTPTPPRLIFLDVARGSKVAVKISEILAQYF